MYFITKVCKSISDDGRSHYKNADKNHSGLFKFRLLDDDGCVYFYGYSDDCSGEDAFAPLDEYGVNFGCTDIQYIENGVYKSL